MTEIHFVFLDDWVGLYIDGKLKDEGHSLDERRVLDNLGIAYTSEWVEYDDPIAEKISRLPNTLDEWEKMKNDN